MSTFRVFQGDALDLLRSLPDASIDMIDVDVAYSSLEKHRATGTTTRLKQSKASSNEWFEIFHNDRFPEFFQECYRVLKKNTHLYFWCDGETQRIAVPIGEQAGFTFWNEIVWVKTKGPMSAENMERADVRAGLGYHYRRAKEYILFFEKGKRKVNDLAIPDVLPFPRISGQYPTEKPTAIHKILISQSTVEGETVLDPFMGSGSAGDAAVRMKRHFIGGDLKQSAVELARQRLIGAGGKEDQSLLYVLPPLTPEHHVENDRQLAKFMGATPAEIPAQPGCQNSGGCANTTACRAMNRCLANEPPTDDELL